MRAFGRDLIRGGHYGQRSCEPHLKAEHMAAPTNAAYVKKALANSEPSTHGTSRHVRVGDGSPRRRHPAEAPCGAGALFRGLKQGRGARAELIEQRRFVCLRRLEM